MQQKVIKINKEQILSDARDVMENTEYPAVRDFMARFIKKIEARDEISMVEFNGTLYPDRCYWCNGSIGETASINRFLPGKIFCSDRCEAEILVFNSKIIHILNHTKNEDKRILN